MKECVHVRRVRVLRLRLEWFVECRAKSIIRDARAIGRTKGLVCEYECFASSVS
jgi:hypothetical protein